MQKSLASGVSIKNKNWRNYYNMELMIASGFILLGSVNILLWMRVRSLERWAITMEQWADFIDDILQQMNEPATTFTLEETKNILEEEK